MLRVIRLPSSITRGVFLVHPIWLLFIGIEVKAQFVEVSEVLGIDHRCVDPDLMSGGVSFLDYNNDGFEDIYIIGGTLKGKLYENIGGSDFEDVTEYIGLDQYPVSKTMGVVTGDLDNDGYTDILLSTATGERNFLFWNQNGQSFKETGINSGSDFLETFNGSSIALGDYNLDGFLDIYIGNYTAQGADYLFKNNGDRTFTNVSEMLGADRYGQALAVAFSDFDNDHDPDILLGNDFGYISHPNKHFVNNYPNNTFTEIGQVSGWDIGINSMGIAVGDYDQDLDQDYYVTDIGGNHFFENQGNGTFAQKAVESGIEDKESTSWGTVFIDFDNDTFLDLYVANGAIGLESDQYYEDKLFRGRENLIYDDVSQKMDVASLLSGRGVACGDYNNDGKLDLVVGVVTAIQEEQVHTLVYSNSMQNDYHWAKISLQGISCNRDGYGAKVCLVSAGRSWIRELGSGGTYLSNNSKVIHFGLGEYDHIDSMIVTWPGGDKDIFNNLEADKMYHIVEGTELFKRRSIVLKKCSSDQIFLQGKYQHEAGVYQDTLSNAGAFKEIVTTRLIINDDVECLTTGTGVRLTKQPELSVFPNPTNGYLQVSLNGVSGMKKLNWNVWTLSGQMILNGMEYIDSNQGFQIEEVKFLDEGVYLLTVLDGIKKYRTKFFKR